MASAILYSTSFNSHQFSWVGGSNSHQFSWLGASYESVLQRACTWVYKKTNFSQNDHYRLTTCFDYSSSSPVFTSPLPAALVPTSPWKSCCSSVPGATLYQHCLLLLLEGPWPVDQSLPWRFHAQSTKVCRGGSMPSRLEFALEIPCPVNQSLPWRSDSQSTKVCLDFIRLLSCTTHVLSCITLVHHSRAPLSCSTHVLSFTTHVLSCTTHILSCTTEKLIIATVNILEILIIATVNIVKILIATV